MKCPTRRRLLAALTCAGGTCCLGVPILSTAQTSGDAPLRRYPPKTLVGKLAVQVFPMALLDGNPIRLAPGARIHAVDNRVVIPSTVSGEQVVRYRLDPLGQIIEVWLLSADEATQALRERG